MVRTIYVVYTSKLKKTLHPKEYAFLCDNDRVNLGDILIDKETKAEMKVVKVSCNSSRCLDGLYLKDIAIETINGIKQFPQQEESGRSINVTLKEAVEWYNSGNTTLKTLALNAYTEKELVENNYDALESKVATHPRVFSIPEKESKKFDVLAKLSVIARYYNKNWERTEFNTGYFIGETRKGLGNVTSQYNGVNVNQHSSVKYAGIVYFKNEADAIQAIKILGEDIKYLF